jgi:alanyl-tRNA synthetase
MSDRIYYTDPYSTRFDATIVAIESAPDGRRAILLDRTAFYPTSGGQPFDTGTIASTRVVDVVDTDDGRILHVVDGASPEGSLRSGGAVEGQIDWPRRFDHMQQHTGQHVLSAAFDRLLKVRTVSFHLGAASSTIDLDREVSGEEIAAAESEANRIVWEDRPVTIRFANADEAAALPLRKEPTREGVLRLIEVEDFDVSACGGTHVHRTGAIGIIVVASSERFRGGSRVEFLCGGRALAGYRALRSSVTNSVRLLSVLPGELPAAIERIQNDAKDLRRELKDLQARLASYEAASLAAAAEPVGPARATVKALDGWDANGLKLIASTIVETPGHVAILLSAPAPSSLVVARSRDLTLDSAALLKQMTGKFGGKGGGRPEMAQGGGLQGEIAEMIAFAQAAIGSSVVR